MREYLQSILNGPIFDQLFGQPWKPISRPVVIAWLLYAGKFGDLGDPAAVGFPVEFDLEVQGSLAGVML